MQRFSRSARRLRQLRWKLTLSYALTAIISFLLAITLIFGGLLLWLGTHASTVILNNLRTQAEQGAVYLANAAHDPALLTAWLQVTVDSDASQSSNSDPFHYRPIFLAMVDPQGNVLASAGTHPLAAGTPARVSLTTRNAVRLSDVLAKSRDTSGDAGEDRPGTLVAIAPVLVRGVVQGALVLKMDQPDSHVLFFWLFSVVFFTGSAAILITAISGIFFGFLIARGLTRRLRRLTTAAEKWSRGDFSARVTDTSSDEIGEMAHRFNQMAEQVDTLLETRRQLAALEERNRLARDLHDSVKQQIFALSMQIASTRLLLKRDPSAAEERLGKMETLVKQAQQELTALIRELRPVALEGKGLAAALREILPQWSQQSEIPVDLQVEGTGTLALSVEEALFRVTQEALANIVRHSHATFARVTLDMTGPTAVLTIQDNGQGFDPARLESRGVGLFSMQERMKTLEGALCVESTPGRGTCVIARCACTGEGEQAQGKESETIPGKSVS